MKINFTKNEMEVLQENVNEIANIIVDATDKELKEDDRVIPESVDATWGDCRTAEDGSYTISIDDEVTVGLLKVALKLASAVKPFIPVAKAFIGVAANTFAEFKEMFNSRLEYGVKKFVASDFGYVGENADKLVYTVVIRRKGSEKWVDHDHTHYTFDVRKDKTGYEIGTKEFNNVAHNNGELLTIVSSMEEGVEYIKSIL